MGKMRRAAGSVFLRDLLVHVLAIGGLSKASARAADRDACVARGRAWHGKTTTRYCVHLSIPGLIMISQAHKRKTLLCGLAGGLTTWREMSQSTTGAAGAASDSGRGCPTAPGLHSGLHNDSKHANLPLCMRGTVDAFEKGPVQVRCEHNAVLSHSLHRPAKRAVCRCCRPKELKTKEWQVLPPVCRVVVIEVSVVLHKLCENVAGSDLASHSLQAAQQGAALSGAGQRCLCLACSPSSHRPWNSLDNRGRPAGQSEH